MSLLEITIISAQDLPPVSKMLRTFAVAYMSPDHKLTTRVDHHGHTNPTWNYRIAFHVDEKFLRQDSSAITIEIYNVAWLRDLPIGTARLFINNMSPPLHKNPSFRRVSLQIARPSGHLQGALNLGVQLVPSTIPGCELNLGQIMESDEVPYEDEKVQAEDQPRSEKFIEEYLEDQVKNLPGIQIAPASESMSTSTSKTGPELESRTAISTAANSLFSAMRPLPTEVAEVLRKGVYSNEWNDYGSSVFENWTEPDSREDDHMLRSRSVKWIEEDQIPLKPEKKRIAGDLIPLKPEKKPSHHPKRRPENRKGLMSCFGNAYGFQFSFICGSKAMKKKKMNRNVKNNFHKVDVPQENTHSFYV